MTFQGTRRRVRPVGLTVIAIAAALSLAGACACLPGETAPLGTDRDIAELEDFIHEEMAAAGVPGLSMAVIRDGAIVYSGAFGVTNTGTGERVTPETLFEAASLSKPLFAYFVMLQAEKGVLDLDRPLYEYLPHPDIHDDPRARELTARMVLAHASGLPNWRSDTGGELRLLFDPGARFGYSGEAYEYLKEVVKHLLGVNDDGLDALFQAEVADEIGAGFMRFTWDASIPERKAFGHRDGIPTDNDGHDMNFGAAYSLNTTAEDYARFLVALIRPEDRHAATVERLLTVQHDIPAEEGELHRSLGFPLKAAERGLRYYHSGNNGDFRAYCHFYLASGDGIVLFGNSDNVFSSNLAQRIVEYLGDEWFYV